MRLVSLFVFSLQWLAIAASPTLLGLFVGVVLSLQSGQLNALTVVAWGAVGFIIGGFWAERIRKQTGLSEFLGRLAGARDTSKRR
ncbi:hypothetical protein swp_0588 [Shewanella piezotolerans WP3]|uniref:Uncharacterized protein n=1 Tax=Shewanella piezotolerans (strain WP3 / JCM 13877) TaxID=225849 RepID=B8CID5_SHEPW|nr:hypothetical protein [Shewanella piezotolerans]ACJ27411.1 hypothetical protein swp_0588 [Shewanella piezotolerans WP3]